MTKMLLKVSAIACLLGVVAVAAPAYVVAADDMETEAVLENMRPNVKAPGPEGEDDTSKGEAMKPAEDQKDFGEEEIEKDMGPPQ